jgi:hypothetical protein
LVVAGLAAHLVAMRRNDYRFLFARARAVSERFGVHSVSLLARNP